MRSQRRCRVLVIPSLSLRDCSAPNSKACFELLHVAVSSKESRAPKITKKGGDVTHATNSDYTHTNEANGHTSRSVAHSSVPSISHHSQTDQILNYNLCLGWCQLNMSTIFVSSHSFRWMPNTWAHAVSSYTPAAPSAARKSKTSRLVVGTSHQVGADQLQIQRSHPVT